MVVSMTGALLCAVGLYLYSLLYANIVWHRVKVAVTPTPSFPLTQQQKREDFLFLYEFLADSYPGFTWKADLYSYDWLAQKARFLAMVESNDDASFYRILRQVLLAVQDGHARQDRGIAPMSLHTPMTRFVSPDKLLVDPA